MPKTLEAHISITTNYLFEFTVPDNYDKEEASMLASDFFEEHGPKDEWIVDGDFQVDDVKELPAEVSIAAGIAEAFEHAEEIGEGE
jgi:hypothetical protein